jgi:hypothetical protein
LFLFSHCGSDLRRDGASDAALEHQRVPQISFEALSPYVSFDRHPDQLRGNPDPVIKTQHRSFDNPLHVQLASNVGQELADAFIGHYGGPGDHA